MFGKPQWFRPKALGWGLVPIRWQGWTYTAGWAGAIGLPFLILIGRHQALEATAWLGISLGALVYDVWQILRAIGGQNRSTAKREDGVLYILDSEPGRAVATRNYNLEVRS
jgi:hypothetical protein